MEALPHLDLLVMRIGSCLTDPPGTPAYLEPTTPTPTPIPTPTPTLPLPLPLTRRVAAHHRGLSTAWRAQHAALAFAPRGAGGRLSPGGRRSVPRTAARALGLTARSR